MLKEAKTRGRKRLDLDGKLFGTLWISSPVTVEGRYIYWTATCIYCGRVTSRRSTSLNEQSNCRCRRLQHLLGKTFGNLTVMDFTDESGVVCLCSCGNYVRKPTRKLHARSHCGCKRIDYAGVALEDKYYHLSLVRTYGITIHDYYALLASQSNRCKLCDIDFALLPRKQIHVDHCHETGKVRGILCSMCNLAIGHLGDTPESIERVLAYMNA